MITVFGATIQLGFLQQEEAAGCILGNGEYLCSDTVDTGGQIHPKTGMVGFVAWTIKNQASFDLQHIPIMVLVFDV